MSINIIDKRVEFENLNKGIFEDIDGKNNLLVTFGGIRQGLGIPVFEFFNSISDIDCDKIFIRDFEQAWYQKGIDSEINTLIKLINFLNETISKNNYKKVCFLGNSMGGYATILFGSIVNVDEVIAFAPQTYIDSWNRFINRDKRWRNQINKIYKFKGKREEYFDLKNYLKKNNKYKTIINIYYSISDNLDKKHAERLRKIENVKLYPINDGGHSVVKIIRDNGNLKKIIESTFK